MEILTKNPFRILGVFANAAPRELVSNKTKISTFLKVKKTCKFPTDLESYLGSVERTEESVLDADSRLTTEQDKLKYGQFWFLNGTPFDIVTSNLLTNGNLDAAILQWQKKESMATLQNCAVAYLIKEDYRNASIYLSKLYTNYSQEFVAALDLKSPLTDEDLIGNIVSTLVQSASNVDQVLLTSSECSPLWIQTTKKQMVDPIIKQLTAALEDCKATKEKSGQERLEAGRKLNKVAKSLFFKLRGLLPANDIQLTNISDKVANEILQCSIDFYNAADSRFAAIETKELLDAAEMLAKGVMIKDRIKENRSTLTGIINSLPPKEVEIEDKQLSNALNRYCEKPDLISHAVTLLNETEPILKTIGQKLGTSHAYYLSRCSTIVQNVLHNLIAEVNDTQNKAGNGTAALSAYKHAVGVATSLTDRLSKLPMNAEVKEHFDKNRATLTDLKKQLDNLENNQQGEDSNFGCLAQLLVYGGIWLLIQMCS